jgi:hypothetical protein
MKTDTPRTDEVAWPETGLVEGDFARQLERELTAVTEQLDRLADSLRELWKNHTLHGAAYELIEQAIAAVEGGSEKPVTLIHNGVGIADMYSRDEFENAMKCTNQTIVSDEAAKQNTKNLS